VQLARFDPGIDLAGADAGDSGRVFGRDHGNLPAASGTIRPRRSSSSFEKKYFIGLYCDFGASRHAFLPHRLPVLSERSLVAPTIHFT
jgi:hypothetical protein